MREALSTDQNAVLLVLMLGAHSSKITSMSVGEITQLINKNLRTKNEPLTSQDGWPGAHLTRVERKRKNNAYVLRINDDLKRKLHELVKRYEVHHSATRRNSGIGGIAKRL